MLTADQLFDLASYRHRALFSAAQPVWSALRDLSAYLDTVSYPSTLFSPLADGVPLREHLVVWSDRLIPGADCLIEFGDIGRGGLSITRDGRPLTGASLIMAGAVIQGENLAIGAGSLIEGGATVKAPTVLGDATEVRQGAYIRGQCLIGDRCVIGHATEIKHSVFLDDSKAGHFAYVGDSVLGNRVNLGAGTKCANLRFIPGSVQIIHDGRMVDTGLRKIGAIFGDDAQTGCNSVTSPGAILGRRALLMPNAVVHSGYHREQSRIGRH